MATRTRRATSPRSRSSAGRSATRNGGRGRAARVSTPAGARGANGTRATNGRAANGRAVTRGDAAWTAMRDGWEARLAESKERPGLYPYTISGTPIRPLYTHEDLAGTDPARDLGVPGTYPFTRGIHASMYRGRMFTMRQFAGFGTPRESNQRYHYLLEHGQTGLSIAFDNPTIMGYDSD